MPTQDQIEQALRKRVQGDNPRNFDEKKWKEKAFERYYGEDDELVNIVVYETTERVVNAEGRTLPVAVWQQLIDEVSPETTPKNAIPKMHLATFAAQPMMANDEGLDTGKPPKPPTLKRRHQRR
jgi:hypothetical protein